MIFFNEFDEEIKENLKEEQDNKQEIKYDEGDVETLDDDLEENEMVLRVKELEAQVKNLQDLNLRLRAEFENFKKRTTKEKARIYNTGQIDCVSEFLPFFDGIERGIETFDKQTENGDVFKGFKMLVDSFTQILKKLEIESFGKKGDEFDPKFHNAIKTLEVDGFGSNLIYEVLQKGYCKGEEVVRHAMVVVANP